MTTLTAPDIVTTATSSITRMREAKRNELEYFSSSVSTEEWDRWAQWLQSISSFPESFEDDLVTSPSLAALELATEVLQEIQDQHYPPPNVVTTGPNGEIIIEWRTGKNATQCVIYDDLRIDRMIFVDGRLKHRDTM